MYCTAWTSNRVQHCSQQALRGLGKTSRCTPGLQHAVWKSVFKGCYGAWMAVIKPQTRRYDASCSRVFGLELLNWALAVSPTRSCRHHLVRTLPCPRPSAFLTRALHGHALGQANRAADLATG